MRKKIEMKLTLFESVKVKISELGSQKTYAMKENKHIFYF